MLIESTEKCMQNLLIINCQCVTATTYTLYKQTWLMHARNLLLIALTVFQAIIPVFIRKVVAQKNFLKCLANVHFRGNVGEFCRSVWPYMERLSPVSCHYKIPTIAEDPWVGLFERWLTLAQSSTSFWEHGCPGFNVNWSNIFSCLKMFFFFTSNVLRSLR